MAFLLLVIFCVTLGCSNTNAPKENDVKANISFTDDSGYEVRMDKPAQRIISLYSAHTENLFSLGLDEEIIGIYKTDAYPPQIRGKKIYDYRSDPEKVIAADPDLVLIRPFIERSKPEFVEALRKADINVVSLYPESFEKFTGYIEKLALLTGKEEKAKELLQKFNADINEIVQITERIEPKANVYFESTENEYRTVTPDSVPAHAIKFAGGINIAADAKSIKEGSSIAKYGAERILEKADKIDVFVAQRGSMNSGGKPRSIRIRPGFYAIKAVQEERLYNINEKLVSSPTFRFAKGVKELARMFYPKVLDDLTTHDHDENVTRKEMAEIVCKFKHKEIFVPSSKYYTSSHRGHVFGDFKDVDVNHPYFDYIETAVLSGYMDGFEDEFRPDEKITRDELASILYMLVDLKEGSKKANILDIDKCTNPNHVSMMVENDILCLDKGLFKPGDNVTGKEVVEALVKMQAIK